MKYTYTIIFLVSIICIHKHICTYIYIIVQYQFEYCNVPPFERRNLSCDKNCRHKIKRKAFNIP